MRSLVVSALTGLLVTLSVNAQAGVVSTENAVATGVTADFLPGVDGSAASSVGVIDVYPDQWSVAPGASVKLKVRSVGAGYTSEVFRVGWYGGSGARAIGAAGTGAADPQPYPTPDGKYGLAAAAWHDSVTVDTTGFTPGLYVARVTQSVSPHRQASTFFVVRDDALTTKQPILFVISFNTHAAYNAWPGMDRGGKSLYAWNSSTALVTETNADVRKGQAVKISFDRPFLVGGGTADVFRWEYPAIRWLEHNGYEVAYALDRDLDANPGLFTGRKAVIYSGHQEYWSGQMFTNALAARDGGVNQIFVSGDTVSWQVRFEDAGATMVGYKENWPNDPIKATDPNAVTRGFRTLPTPRPAIQLTGVQSSGQIKDSSGVGTDYPWADLIVSNPSHWIYAGTGLKSGDHIKSVMGYEVDSCSNGSPEFDAYRPAGQTLLGTITQPWDSLRKGSPCFYAKTLASGKNVEVIGLGSMAFTWALDDYALKQGYPSAATSVDSRAQKMMSNVLARWTAGDVPPYTAPTTGDDAGVDPMPEDPDGDGGVVPTADGGADGAVTDAAAPDSAVADAAVDSTTGEDATTSDATTTDSAVTDDAAATDDAGAAPAPETESDSSCTVTQAVGRASGGAASMLMIALSASLIRRRRK